MVIVLSLSTHFARLTHIRKPEDVTTLAVTQVYFSTLLEILVGLYCLAVVFNFQNVRDWRLQLVNSLDIRLSFFRHINSKPINLKTKMLTFRVVSAAARCVGYPNPSCVAASSRLPRQSGLCQSSREILSWCCSCLSCRHGCRSHFHWVIWICVFQVHCKWQSLLPHVS